MFDAFLVAWRESAEALLIVAMLRECLQRSGQSHATRLIKPGLWLAGLGLCVCAIAIIDLTSEPAFDALLTIAAATGVALMAMGMAVSAGGIHRRVSTHLHDWADHPRAPVILVGMVSLLILREGLEMFILLRAITSSEGLPTALTGAGLGLMAAVLTTRIWTWARARFGLLIVFRVSAVLLLSLAAKLAVQGCLDLIHTRWLPIDHEYWLAMAVPLLDDGPWLPLVYAALLLPPLFYFLKTWWQEAEFADVDRERDAPPLQ